MTRGISQSGAVRPWLGAALVAAVLIAAAVPVAAEIHWHESYEAALAAADRADKPILVFVYLSEQTNRFSGPREEIRLNRQGRSRTGRLDAHMMLEQTLTAPEVAAAAEGFEAVKLDLVDPATDDARRALRVSPGVDVATETRAAMYPISVFLDSAGQELFRRHGSMSALGYATLLDQASQLHDARNAVLDDPQDAVARRNLGRAYMEMAPAPEDHAYTSAVEHLEAAVRLDPQNESGAKFDAQVDLAILSVAEAPAEAIQRLTELQTEDEDSHRRLEIEYYVAVAHFVQENVQAARQILSRFENPGEDSPYFDSPWTPQALGLLQYIKQLGD